MISRSSRKQAFWRRKWFYFVAAIVVAILAIGALEATNVIHLFHHSPKSNSKVSSGVRPPNSVDYSAANPSDNAANDTRKSSSNPADTLDNGPTASNVNNPLGVVIVNAQRNGTDIRVGNIVTGATSGTCTLTATQDGQPSPAPVTAQVQLDVNNYDCGVMHITLLNSGTWQVKLTVNSGTQSASATTAVKAN